MPKRMILLTGMITVFAGCLLLPRSGGIDRSIDAPVDRVLQAAVDVLQDWGFALEKIDRSAGLIVTERRPSGVGTNRSPRPVEKAEVRLEANGSQTTVHLSLQFVDQVSGPPRRVSDDGDDERTDDLARAVLDRSADADVVYDDYLDAIADRVRDLRGTDTS